MCCSFHRKNHAHVICLLTIADAKRKKKDFGRIQQSYVIKDELCHLLVVSTAAQGCMILSTHQLIFSTFPPDVPAEIHYAFILESGANKICKKIKSSMQADFAGDRCAHPPWHRTAIQGVGVYPRLTPSTWSAYHRNPNCILV